jgi:GNAT superfamily N-acetyltransferase
MAEWGKREEGDRMDIIYTNAQNPDFARLCVQLDAHLNQAAGGERRRAQYARYNTLESIHGVFLALEGGSAVGCAAFKRFDARCAEVKRVFVQDTSRGKGIARALMAALEAEAKKQGFTALILETGRALAPAVRMYEKLGYRVTENYGQYKNMPESVCMRKEL